MPAPRRLRTLRSPLAITLVPIALFVAVAFVLIPFAPGPVARFNTIFLFSMLSVQSLAFALSQRLLRRFLAYHYAKLDETIKVFKEVIARMEANPATAAAGRRALDGIRNVWGEEADRWFDRSPLN